MQFPDQLAELLPRVRQAAQDYDYYPAAPTSLQHLRDLRHDVAQGWLAAVDRPIAELWTPEAQEIQRLFTEVGLRYEGLTAAEEEQAAAIGEQLRSQPDCWPLWPAALLYRRADEWPLRFVGVRPPLEFLEFFVQSLVWFPCFFREVGEVDRYGAFLESVVDYLHERARRYPQESFWREMTRFFVNHSNFVPLYFCQHNVRSPFAKRAALVEWGLENFGHTLDYELGPRPADRAKIRLGILKANFSSHPETFTTFPVFEHLDRDRFEVVIYILNDGADLLAEYTARRPGDRVVQLTGPLEAQVATLRAEEIDILWVGTIVTNSLQRVLMLAAHRVARVQIHSVSSPVTSGLKHIDYYCSGSYSESPEATEHYTETLLLTEGSGHRFDYSLEPVQARLQLSRSDLNLAPDQILFTSGANLFKVIPEQRETWAKLLARVPQSVLVLYPFGASWRRGYPKMPFWQRFQQVLADRGLDPARLILLNRLPSRADVRVLLDLADIYLDSYPFTGANSIADALEAGLPAVTRQGPWFRSRQGAALLREVGLDRWIAEDEVGYLERAVCLAQDADLRRAVREQLQRAISAGAAFFDSRRYAAQLQPLFEQVMGQS